MPSSPKTPSTKLQHDDVIIPSIEQCSELESEIMGLLDDLDRGVLLLLT